MLRKLIPLVIVALAATTSTAFAQSTGMPQYYAPYRAFENHEIGGTLSFPNGDATGVEGLFGFGYKAFDIGLRGGVITNGATDFMLGADGRVRVVTQTESFPASIVTGIRRQRRERYGKHRSWVRRGFRTQRCVRGTGEFWDRQQWAR